MDLKKWTIGVMAFVVLVVTFYGGLVLFLTWPISEYSVSKSGAFGDSFGVITSLFSGLAFGGLILAILLQRQDLQLQKEELSLTRKEIKAQNFESTFFQMLRLHNDIINSIDLRGAGSGGVVITTGRDCFVTFKNRLHRLYDSEKKSAVSIDELELVRESYEKFWADNKHELGHYFRYLYRIFKFVDGNDAKNKKLYTSIVRSQLSDQELLLLFYNCLTCHGVDKFKPIAEKYALFDNLPISMLFHKSHIDLYEAAAWGENPELPNAL
jgi:hypothetical protein